MIVHVCCLVQQELVKVTEAEHVRGWSRVARRDNTYSSVLVCIKTRQRQLYGLGLNDMAIKLLGLQAILLWRWHSKGSSQISASKRRSGLVNGLLSLLLLHLNFLILQI